MGRESHKDIKPISEFRAKTTVLLKKIRTTRRPLIITHRGRKTAVVLAVEDYEALLAKIELLADLAAAKLDIATGDVETNQDIRQKFHIQSKRT
jgi:prevent-host-death family protein